MLSQYHADLATIITDHVIPSAIKADQAALFPRETVRALGKAGLLALTTSKDAGGQGLGFSEAAYVVEKLASECASTAMIVCMHYCANSVIEKYAPLATRQAVARGEHLSTLAFSEQGSRSHFWAPLSTAMLSGDAVQLSAKKSWITSAGEADSYVWSSKPLSGTEASTIWFVPAKTSGLTSPAPFDGLGMRGNASKPVTAEKVSIKISDMLGEDGQGFGIMMGDVLPLFSVLNASASIGIMSSALQKAITHISATSFDEVSQRIVDLPTIRGYIARAKIELDSVTTLRDDTIVALQTNRADAMLRVLEIKAAAGEAALRVTDSAMRVCGGAAFRKEVGVERCFRDARAASVMAPTSDVLYDFIGKAVSGLPLF